MAWDICLKKICIQTDSKTVMSMLTNNSSDSHQHDALVLEFQELCFRHWEVNLNHVYREANYATDYLANLGHNLNIGLHLFSISDSDLSSWLRYDLVGVAMPRAVMINN
ncbi:Putative ribonuclease H protein At1g65750 [Linum perenne]